MELKLLGVYGPYPKAGNHASSSYLVKSDRAKIVLDFGSGALTRLLAETPVEELDGIVISHSHFDHTSDLLPLNYLAERYPDRKIKLYVPKDGDNWYLKILNMNYFEAIEVDAGESLEIKDLKLEFYPVRHTVKTLGVSVSTARGGESSLFYTSDTVWFPELTEYIRGAKLVLADAAKPEGFLGPHMGWDKAVVLSDACDGKIVATHLTPDYDPSDKLLPLGIDVAREGALYVL